MFTLRPTETNSKFIKLFKKEEKKKLVFLSFERLNGVKLYISMYGYSFFFLGGGGVVYHEFVNFSYNLWYVCLIILELFWLYVSL